MSINPELLIKAAKVYDCSEPVEGMTPKMQYEEHKKMTPDEFSRENSKSEEKTALNAAAVAPLVAGSSAFPVEGWNKLRDSYTMPKVMGLGGAGVGSLAGGLYGLATSRKGKRMGAILRGMLGGGLVGGGAGLGAGLAVRGAMPEAKYPPLFDLKTKSFARGATPEETFGMSGDQLHSRLGTALLGGGALGLTAGGLGAAALTDRPDDEEEKKSASARTFGSLVARVTRQQ